MEKTLEELLIEAGLKEAPSKKSKEGFPESHALFIAAEWLQSAIKNNSELQKGIRTRTYCGGIQVNITLKEAIVREILKLYSLHDQVEKLDRQLKAKYVDKASDNLKPGKLSEKHKNTKTHVLKT